jgi:hypothetical protein
MNIIYKKWKNARKNTLSRVEIPIENKKNFTIK